MSRRSPRDERRRALGQNFLRDERVVADVLGTLHPPPGALVVDLGAGAGALTLAAAREGHRVLAVEIDPVWARVLRERTAALDVVEVRRGDALAVRLPPEPFWAVSAAPYGIGTALVRRLLSDAHGLAGAAVVLQRETARRLAGRPRTGRFAATWAPWFELAVTREIPAGAFRPRPSVESALLLVTPRRRPLLSPAAFGAYVRFLDRPFAGRGRTLRDRLGPGVAGALADAGLPRSATPSAVPPEAYAALFSALAVTAA
jgi:23S rRNA (adenine-N6)-dimethyltransferase